MTVTITTIEGQTMQERLQALLLKVCQGTATVQERREMTRLSLKIADLPKETREDIRARKVSRLTALVAERAIALLYPVAKMNGRSLSLGDTMWYDLMGAMELCTGGSLDNEQFQAVLQKANKRILHREQNPITRKKKSKAA